MTPFGYNNPLTVVSGAVIGGGGWGGEDYADDEFIYLSELELDVKQIRGLPITLGRLMKALDTQNQSGAIYIGGLAEVTVDIDTMAVKSFHWTMTLPNGQEATLEDQSPETVEALYNLLCR